MHNGRRIKNALRKFAERANAEVECINNGGCCVVTAIIGEWLEHIGVKCEAVTPCGGEWGAGDPPAVVRQRVNNRHSMRDWKQNGLSFAHVAVRFVMPSGRVVIWDTEGFYHSRQFGPWEHYAPAEFGHGLTIAEARAMADAPDRTWNPRFDRDNIPTLEALAREVFEPMALQTEGA